MNRISVIAVEAEIKVGRVVFAVCHKLGFDVRVFHDALDALMEAARLKPNLMIFEADMPLLGSVDFADVISRDPQFKSVALIAIVDEMDAAALRRYSARKVTVVVKSGRDDGALRRRLSRILKPHATCGSSVCPPVPETTCAKEVS